MKTLLKNALIVTMNAREEVINCKGKMIMPGLANTHVHISQQPGRGLGDDVNLLPYIITLIALLGSIGRSNEPESLSKPYIRGSR